MNRRQIYKLYSTREENNNAIKNAITAIVDASLAPPRATLKVTVAELGIHLRQFALFTTLESLSSANSVRITYIARPARRARRICHPDSRDALPASLASVARRINIESTPHAMYLAPRNKI